MRRHCNISFVGPPTVLYFYQAVNPKWCYNYATLYFGCVHMSSNGFIFYWYICNIFFECIENLFWLFSKRGLYKHYWCQNIMQNAGQFNPGIVQGQYHECWWPGPLRRQVISNHGIEDVWWTGLPRGGIATTCATSLSRNEIKENTYVTVLSHDKLTLKGPIPYIYGTQVWLSLCLQMS